MKKFKTIKVTFEEENGKSRTESIVFKPVEIDTSRCIVCDKCYYTKLCRYLPDPRYMNNKDYCFTDYCSDLSVDNNGSNTELCNMIPLEGELERVFKDKNIFKNIIDSDPLYKLSELIDKACPGMCEFYNKDHSGCSVDNKLCIFRELFINSKYEG